MQQLEQGWTLPANWYTDPNILQQEQEAIFKRTWQFVGHMQNVAQPGDYFTTRCAHVPIVITRDLDGIVRGFVNVCRHRSAEVALGAGNRSTLQCPYHAWTYGLDGTLHHAPRCDRERQFNPTELALIPVKVECWESFIFVNLDLNAPPLHQYLGALPEVIASSGVNIKALKLHKRTEFDMAANWKVVAENYLECYHCPSSHTEFCKVIEVDPAQYLAQAIDNTLIAKAPLHQSNHWPYDARGVVQESQYTLLWPNSTFNIFPGRGNLLIYWFTPINPQRTFGAFEYYFTDEVDAEYEQEFTAFLDRVGFEDLALVESVQRGLESGMVPQGRLMLDSEQLIQAFQQLVQRSLKPASVN